MASDVRKQIGVVAAVGAAFGQDKIGATTYSKVGNEDMNNSDGGDEQAAGEN